MLRPKRFSQQYAGSESNSDDEYDSFFRHLKERNREVTADSDTTLTSGDSDDSDTTLPYGLEERENEIIGKEIDLQGENIDRYPR